MQIHVGRRFQSRRKHPVNVFGPSLFKPEEVGGSHFLQRSTKKYANDMQERRSVGIYNDHGVLGSQIRGYGEDGVDIGHR